VVAGIAVAAIAVAAFALTRGDGGGLPFVDDQERPTPAFAFTVTRASYEATAAKGDKNAQEKAADREGKAVAEMLSTLYATAFVDPDTWGDVGAIEDSFTGEAMGRLEGDVEVLTIGTGGGYEFVTPEPSTVSIVVLTDPEGQVLRAHAQVEFTALAELSDGTFTTITSTGDYFVVRDGDSWKIEAYRIDRDEEAREAPASPSASTSASATGADA